ncbi:MAG: hypothetical protein Ct9H300mP25_04450 [Acidobacteriota bacterium]|nr:MAG: hypothetical protein Ct9H300mP25_04450 [Acidobacteriota bacterium]
MTYRPSVTIKDYTWNGSAGYLNPVPGAEPARYQTLSKLRRYQLPTPTLKFFHASLCTSHLLSGNVDILILVIKKL